MIPGEENIFGDLFVSDQHRAGPHEFTIDRRDGSRKSDLCHISGELRGAGKRGVHIYLGDLGTRREKYNNATVIGESLIKKRNNKLGLDSESWGITTWNQASTSGPSASTSTNLSTHTTVMTSAATTPSN